MGDEPADDEAGGEDRLVFVDFDSVDRDFRAYARQLYRRETRRVLDQLPAEYRAKFDSIGFCRGRPVQVVSPYQVPLGKLRAEWMEAFRKVR